MSPLLILLHKCMKVMGMRGLWMEDLLRLMCILTHWRDLIINLLILGVPYPSLSDFRSIRSNPIKMHTIQFFLSAAIVIAGIIAAPCENPPFVATGWEGPGTYSIVNAKTGTSVDLYQGKTNIVGWQTYILWFSLPSYNKKVPNHVVRDPNTNNQKWIITSVNSAANTWAIQNTGTRGAITSNGCECSLRNTKLYIRPTRPFSPFWYLHCV